MLVTAQILRELGAKNVIALDAPVTIVNGGAAAVRTMKYESLDEVKLANWFQDSNAGALLIVCEGSFDDSDEYVVRLFDFSRWKTSWGEDEFSPLSLYRAKKNGQLKQEVK